MKPRVALFWRKESDYTWRAKSAVDSFAIRRTMIYHDSGAMEMFYVFKKRKREVRLGAAKSLHAAQKLAGGHA